MYLVCGDALDVVSSHLFTRSGGGAGILLSYGYPCSAESGGRAATYSKLELDLEWRVES